jgi:hypothetical protein
MIILAKIITCTPDDDCVAILELMPPLSDFPDKRFIIHLKLNTNEYGYMAAGFTKTKSKMNNMLVLECVLDARDGNIYSYLSWNSNQPNNPSKSNKFPVPIRAYGAQNNSTSNTFRLSKSIKISSPIKIEGFAYCEFIFDKKFSFRLSSGKTINVDFSVSEYTVSIAVGNTNDGEADDSCKIVKKPSNDYRGTYFSDY